MIKEFIVGTSMHRLVEQARKPQVRREFPRQSPASISVLTDVANFPQNMDIISRELLQDVFISRLYLTGNLASLSFDETISTMAQELGLARFTEDNAPKLLPDKLFEAVLSARLQMGLPRHAPATRLAR